MQMVIFPVKNFHNQFLGTGDALESLLYLKNKKASTGPCFCLGKIVTNDKEAQKDH